MARPNHWNDFVSALIIFIVSMVITMHLPWVITEDRSFWHDAVNALTVFVLFCIIFSIQGWLTSVKEWLLPSRHRYFTILITDFGDDPDGRHAAHVRVALGRIRHLDAQLLDVPLKLCGLDSQIDARLEAERQGHTLLETHKGQVLVSGEVCRANGELHLWFLYRLEGAYVDKGSYSDTEVLNLPLDFGQDLEAQLAAVTLTRITLIGSQTVKDLAHTLRPIIRKLRTQQAQLLEKDTAAERTRLLYALGLAATKLGQETENKKVLKQAIVAFEDIPAAYAGEQANLDEARVKTGLGYALLVLGGLNGDASKLRAGLAALESALKDCTRVCAPLDWAYAQNGLGIAFNALGDLENDEASLALAAAAHKSALSEWTRERVPFSWAKAQDDLGLALFSLGLGQSGTARLEEAIAAHRAALEIYSREHNLDLWAEVKNNLGNALQALGERETGTVTLETSLQVYEEAMEAVIMYQDPSEAPNETDDTERTLVKAFYVDGLAHGIDNVQALLKERRAEAGSEIGM